MSTNDIEFANGSEFANDIEATVLRLNREIAMLLRESRDRSGLAQVVVANRTGISRPRLSDYECGRRSPSLSVVARILAAMGRQLTLGVERVDARDPAGEHLRLMAPGERIAQSASVGLLARLDGFDFVIDGLSAALLHAVPVRADVLELAVADLDGFADWLERIDAHRYVPAWNAFAARPDPREPGPLLWGARGGRVTVHMGDKLPPAVPMTVGGKTLPVRALWDLEFDDVNAAIALRKTRASTRAARLGAGGCTDL